MMTSGSVMSYEHLAALMDSMGDDVTITYVSDNRVDFALDNAHSHVNFDTDWNMDESILRWVDEASDPWFVWARL